METSDLDGDPAVDDQGLAGHGAGERTGQPDRGVRHFFGAGEPLLQRRAAGAGVQGAPRPPGDLVPAVVDLAAGRVPVVAAGGIADGRGLAAMMMLGAGGVLLGTRFYASQEADGAEEAKRRICAASSGSTSRAK